MDKKEALLMKAQDAFWEVIADNHPEIKTGNFSPFDALYFDGVCKQAYEIWLKSNKEE